MKENDHIQSLDDSQLDGIVGGTAVPQPLTKYVSKSNSPIGPGTPIFTFHKGGNKFNVKHIEAARFDEYLKKQSGDTVITFEGHENEHFTVKQLLAYYK